MTTSYLSLRWGVSAALGASLWSVAAGGAAAAEHEWKMHVTFVPNRPECAFAEKFAAYTEEETGGQVAIQVFCGGTLGVKDQDTLRWLPPGNAVQATWLVPEYMSRDAPEYAYILPVGVVDDVRKLEALKPVLWDIEEATYEKWGIHMVSWAHLPLDEMQIICKEPVNTLAQLKDKKLRVFAKYHVDAFAALGISAQVIPQSELYVALQTGVVDCAFYPIAYAASISLQEVAPYAAYIGTDIPAPPNVLIAQPSWDALSQEQQAAVTRAAERMEQEAWTFLTEGDYDEEGAKKFAAGGGTILDPFPEADQAAYVDAHTGLWEEVAKGVGPEAHENYLKVKAALDAAS
jgi:TRAP-type transport system periplasmic protein